MSNTRKVPYVHYFASRKEKFVIVSKDNRPVGEKIPVKGIVEARKIVKNINGEAWNF